MLTRKPQEAMLLVRSHIERSKVEVRKITLHRLHSAHASATQPDAHSSQRLTGPRR